MLIASTSDRFNESFRLRSSNSKPRLLVVGEEEWTTETRDALAICDK
jgi:hypothetical protein